MNRLRVWLWGHLYHAALFLVGVSSVRYEAALRDRLAEVNAGCEEVS